MNDDALKELLKRLERIEGVIDYPIKKQSLLLVKLKEQGTQRGILMLIASVFPMIGLPVEDTVSIMSAIFAIIGIQNVVTDG